MSARYLLTTTAPTPPVRVDGLAPETADHNARTPHQGMIFRRAGRRRSRYPGAVERPELSVAVRREAGEVVVHLVGEIDVSTASKLATSVGGLLAEGSGRVVLDMGGVTFCDSQGLGTLVVLSRRARMMGTALVLVNVGDFLLRVLDITGLRTALMIH